MSEVENAEGKIKVVDRRRFDESGELRPDQPAPQTKDDVRHISAEPERPEEAAAEPESRADTEEPNTGHGTAGTSNLMLDLIAGLAQQAEMLLVGGQGLPAQPAEAQRVIEVLAMLETKTRGNLSQEEARILSGVIFQLRSLFVEQSP